MKPENRSIMEIWVRTLTALLDADQNKPSIYPQIIKDLQLILDDEKKTTQPPIDGPVDGETWEQWYIRTKNMNMINVSPIAKQFAQEEETKNQEKDNMDHIET